MDGPERPWKILKGLKRSFKTIKSHKYICKLEKSDKVLKDFRGFWKAVIWAETSSKDLIGPKILWKILIVYDTFWKVFNGLEQLFNGNEKSWVFIYLFMQKGELQLFLSECNSDNTEFWLVTGG